MSVLDGTLKIFSGNSNRALAAEICRYLKRPVGDAEVRDFADGETWVKIDENIRGDDIFVIQSTNSPASNIMELVIMLDALRRSSPRRVTAVIPYFGYARQDRKDQARVPITAKLMANLITTAGADRVLTMDLHSAQIQGFFDIPFDHLFASPVFVEQVRMRTPEDLVVVAPDIGSVKMARAYATRLDVPLALIDKRRTEHDEIEVMNVIGEVDGKNVVMFDDIVSTGGTLMKAAKALKKRGALNIMACVTHGVFSGKIFESLDNSDITNLFVTNTIYHDPVKMGGSTSKVEILSVGRILGEAIHRIHQEESLSSLFI
ncbi:MAG: ribose-phosphate pyrophosphokinase [Candidatus Eisenbacteria bacterium]|uniref:Ribose-phosphate pyrophosphokinase n=1 Tax=Eiseniibacteriota bacterium TaxID=2212470 RepID=A0A7Y2H1B3_UNCEI|nr:ribose-phosphate pyrophosphokinase [Candidatus Eisenbacteria bacterium]